MNFGYLKVLFAEPKSELSLLSSTSFLHYKSHTQNFWKRFRIYTKTLPFKCINPIQNGLFRGCSWKGRRGGGAKRPHPLPKICHRYPTMMKLGTVIPCLKKIQKIYESRDTPIEFCWYQHFFTGNQQILVYQEIQI